MHLHQLNKSKQKSRRRVGRGGKRGTTSGKGQKGQRSRSGHRMRPASRDLILRLPKRRGFANRTKSPKPTIFNLADLAPNLKKTAAPLVLNKAFLKEAGFLPKNYYGEVKILGSGEVGLPITIDGLMVSKSAKEKIEKAGGTIK